MEACKHVLASANGDGRLALTATDLEVTFVAQVKAAIEDHGEALLPARTLAAWVGTASEDDMNPAFDAEKQAVRLRCGSSRASVKRLPIEAFPETKAGGEPIVELEAASLRSMVVIALSQPPFSGVVCGFSGAADPIAAINIGRRADANQPHASGTPLAA